MLFLTIIAIFPHVQTHFLERVWKKFVLEAEDYRFCKTIPDEHMQTKAATPPGQATSSRSGRAPPAWSTYTPKVHDLCWGLLICCVVFYNIS